jgi:GNAT superfamily N-acetyltransferase
MSDAIRIESLQSLGPREIEELSDVLIDCVEGGASVSFMLPLPRSKALDFWRGIAVDSASGKRLVVTAKNGAGTIVGTAQLILNLPDNQSHRGDVAKMLVHRSVRRQGVGASLLAAVEEHALELGRTLLVLDTVTDGDAYRMYLRQGWQRCGDIPNYALWPDGRLCSTTYFFKQLGRRSK